MAETRPLSIVLTGDLVLDEPDGAYWLAGIAPALRAAKDWTIVRKQFPEHP